MLVAYEPVWAIGTGKTATPEDAAVVHSRHPRGASAKRSAAQPTRCRSSTAGASTPATRAALLAAPEVDGLLVGGASLDADAWTRICEHLTAACKLRSLQ